MPEFDAARRAALMADLLRPLLGRPADLLSFDAVRDRLHLRSFVDRGIQEVPLDRIVGSLGRSHEFTRAFLPREEALRERWERVKDLADGTGGFPPVELYQVGEAYFVVDGHHRISVARQLGGPTIEAHVREFATPVPVGSDDSIAALIERSGRADFMEATGLDTATADALASTTADAWARLLDHISGHRCYLGLDEQREIPWPEAVASWRWTVYQPVVEAIRRRRVLDDFPGTTEADLYLFVMDHLHQLRQRYGPGVGADALFDDAAWRAQARSQARDEGLGSARARRPPKPRTRKPADGEQKP